MHPRIIRGNERRAAWEALKMAIDFVPQFHKKLTQHDNHTVWVALPHPRSLIPQKTNFYRSWQREECEKLEAAGEIVLAFAVSH